MSNEKIYTILVIFIIVYVVSLGIILPKLKKKKMQKAIDHYTKVLDDLKIGDEVLLTSGIICTLKEMGKDIAKVEIANGVVIRIEKMSIMGRHESKKNKSKTEKEEQK